MPDPCRDPASSAPQRTPSPLHRKRADASVPADQAAIIRELLQRFNDMLHGLTAEPGVVHVPTLGTLTASEWHDELHPTSKGFKKIAGKFAAELAKQFPGTFPA